METVARSHKSELFYIILSQLIKLKVTGLKQMFKRIKPNGKKDFVS